MKKANMIKERREALGMTPGEVAEAARISKAVYMKAEEGNPDGLGYADAWALSIVLKTDVKKILQSVGAI